MVKTTQKKLPASEGEKWLLAAKVEFWLYVVSVAAVLLVMILSFIFLIPAFSLVLGPLIVFFYTPLAYLAGAVAVVDFVAVLRMKNGDEKLRTEIIRSLFPVSVMLFGFSLMAVTRGNIFYILGLFMPAGISWVALQPTPKHKVFKKSTLDVLSVIMGLFFILNVIILISGVLFRSW